MHRSPLTDNWTVRFVAGPEDVPDAVKGRDIAASVPGCVHTDLLANGLIDDPYLADNEQRLFWIGRSDWAYRCRFNLTADQLATEHLDLACDGLDTIATLWLNDHSIGDAGNMFCAHRFHLKPGAKQGENELLIRFAAPVPYVENQEASLGHLPHSGEGSNAPHPFNQIRKMACNFGWDWGPDVPTVGIWKPIHIEAWHTARIAYVRPLVLKATADQAILEVHVDLVTHAVTERSEVADLHHSHHDLCATLIAPYGEETDSDSPPPPRRGGSRGSNALMHRTRGYRHGVREKRSIENQKLTPTRSNNVLTFTIPTPQRWWPAGHGDQPLYDLTVTLGDLDTWQGRVGLRTVSLDLTSDPAPVGDPIPDAQGERMTLLVNDKPIFLKGANWIPDDCFPSRVTANRYRERIAQAKAANMNLLRVWGGGIYESDDFYDICDEMGILVWQDFCFACAAYTEDEPMWSSVEAEARHNINRLCRHPSLAIWNGCNENIMAVWDWGSEWQALRRDHMKTWGLGYYLSLFPKLMKQLDPSRPYWPGSPYSGSFERPANLNAFGNRHIWDVWHGPGEYRNYLAHYPRMATEFGFHGPPTWPTLARAIPENQRRWDSPIMRLHNKNGGRNGMEQSTKRMADDYDPPLEPERFDDWLYLSQSMQARALELGVTWFRALSPWCSGAVYWQFNDCWPVASWSAIDGNGRCKPLWFASRKFFADRIVTIKPRRVTGADGEIGKLAVYLHNDHDSAWAGVCVIRQMSLAGEVIARHDHAVDIAPRSLEKFEAPDSMHDDPHRFLVAELAGGERGFWWFSPDKELDYAAPDIGAELAGTDDGYAVNLRSNAVVRDICIFADRLDPNATVSDQFFTLLPGESRIVIIETSTEMSLDDLLKPPVLNCANRFGVKPQPNHAEV